MFTTKIGVDGAATYLNGAFQTGWIPGEQEDLSSPTLKKPVTAEYVTANQIKIVGLDWSDRIQKGTKIRYKQGGEYKYNVVSTITANADSVLALSGGSTVDDEAITDFWFSNSINPIGWPEYLGLADIGGWNSGLTAAYASATSITIAGIDVTDRIQKGTKIRYKQGGDYKYDFVSSAAFSTDTTLTLLGGSTVEDEAITEFWFSNIATPIGWPFGVDYIEGSNANGTWRKWADGTLECWGILTLNIDINITVGSVYRSPNYWQFTWPVEFITAPEEHVSIKSTSQNYVSIMHGNLDGTTTQSTCRWVTCVESVTGVTIQVNVYAKGMWK